MAFQDPAVLDEIQKLLRFYRANLLDALELQSNPDQWHLVRRQVLRNLGEQGFEGALIKILSGGLK